MNVTFDLICKFMLKQSELSCDNWKQSACSSVGFGYIMVYNGKYEIYISDNTSERDHLLY